MAIITELARAKINLSLKILGKRPDGYHELESLVVFADVGDVVALDPGDPGRPIGVTTSGPYADALSGENLIDRTLQLLRHAHPDLKLGGVHLEKRLPVAAGIGGGSADAAAVIRAVIAANPASGLAHDSWHAMALQLGADVPVCLASHAAWMRGTGERLTPRLRRFPALAAVLVNPMAPVPADKTARVFKALAAPLIPATPQRLLPSTPEDWDGILAFLAANGNDLEAPACAVVPETALVLNALRAFPGVAASRMSGAGPTCFALFKSDADAAAAAAALRMSCPQWWVCETRLNSS